MRASKPSGAKRIMDVSASSLQNPDSVHTGGDSASVQFTASFDGKHTAIICADIGADDNIIDDHMLTTIQKNGAQVDIQDLPKPRMFRMAACLEDGTPTFLKCERIATVDTELLIRHGSALCLRGLRWFVTYQVLGEPLLGRPLLGSLGLNTRNILAATADRYHGSVEASSLLQSEYAHDLSLIHI